MSNEARNSATAPGESHTRSMTYQDLRRMTECAASYDGPAWIVIDETGWRVETNKPAEKAGQVLIPYNNNRGKKPQKQVPEVVTASMQPKDGAAVDLLSLTYKDQKLGPADAVFWSQAAVEKFVVPYYASVYADEAPGKLENIINVLGTVNTPSGTYGTGETLEPFALAHMPKSEYVQVEGAFAVLAKTSAGGQVAVPITEYLKPKEEKQETA